MRGPGGQGLWELLSCSVPERFKGQVPLFQVIKGYRLARGEERLCVERTFCNCAEGTRISYEGPQLTEMVYVNNGEITSVDSHYRPRRGLPAKTDDKKAAWEKLNEIFNPPKTEVPQYHTIKRFAVHLEFLVAENPEWRKDIEAVLHGSGEGRNDCT